MTKEHCRAIIFLASSGQHATFIPAPLSLHLAQQLLEILLALGLVHPQMLLHVLGDVHGAELWAAHGAVPGLLVILVLHRLVARVTSGLRVQRELELRGPI